MIVTLTEEEILNVEEQAIVSMSDVLKNDRKPAWGQSTDRVKQFAQNREGRFYEAAVCKFQGIPYVCSLFGIDAGKYEVRGTKYKNGRLILHPTDKDNAIYILVVGQVPTFNLVGWIAGKNGKQDKFLDDPVGGRLAYFVPQEELSPVEELY